MVGGNKQFFDIDYRQLRTASGMEALDAAFLASLSAPQRDELVNFRQQGATWTEEQYGSWLLTFAPVVSQFIAQGFALTEEVAAYRSSVESSRILYQFQSGFIKRLKHRAGDTADLDYLAATKALSVLSILESDDPELVLARVGCDLMESDTGDQLKLIEQWCLAALFTPEGRAAVKDWSLFRLPKKLNMDQLVPVVEQADEMGGQAVIPNEMRQAREGFDLTDPGMTSRHLHSEAEYCVYCHEKEGDFCTKGFPVKKGMEPLQWRPHATGELMLGCPVGEKISQMHWLYAEGDVLAAFIVVMADNPLCALTGHRICNDCMKSCIYQKRTPVNTPEVETGVLMDVLRFSWGVEIYDILMRWNPLRRTQVVEKKYNGRRILVMGLGPAGIAVTHHLLMEGCGVVAVDGLNLQPLPVSWCEAPIKDLSQIWEPLLTRPVRGFGGVAEYGITVRWNKNFLTLIQLLYQRRPKLLMRGDVRFGGTLVIEDAWALGFDHLSLAVGAGLPREIKIPNSLAPGMRQANDFLMALQLTNAGRPGSLSALQLKMPVIVIGGGLTGVDAATEAQAYYVQQLIQVAQWFDGVANNRGREQTLDFFAPHERAQLIIWLEHAEIWADYLRQCRVDKTPIDVTEFVKRWGGVTIVYRKRMCDSPAYRHNHEELTSAMREGIGYRDCLSPIAVVCDEYGEVSGVRFKTQVYSEEGWTQGVDEYLLPAGTVLCATGASPNVAYEFEHSGSFLKKNGAYRPHRFSENHLILDERNGGHCKSDNIGMLTNYHDDQHMVSLLGDAHPWFRGSVVKAVASGKAAYPQVLSTLSGLASSDEDFDGFKEKLNEQFRSRLSAKRWVAERLVEWVVHAPWLASKHRPGQFYRVTSAQPVGGKTAEAASLLGIVHPDHKDCLVFLLQGDTTAEKLLFQVEVGADLSVMGPTGSWTAVPAHHQHLLVIGGMKAFIYLCSIASSWQQAGHVVSWLNTDPDFNLPEEELLSAVADQVQVLPGQLEVCVLDYLGGLSEPDVVTAVHSIGDHALLCQVQNARQTAWEGRFAESVYWVGSTYGPMQCMLKGVCAQCLQWQVDPVSGKRTKAVYACSWQHQPMDLIDLAHLSDRQTLKSLQDRLAMLYLDCHSFSAA